MKEQTKLPENERHFDAALCRAIEGAAPDPFNPERYRLSSDYSPDVGVKKLLTAIPVRKPAKHWFVRTHPDRAYRLDTVVLELKEERELYLVEPELVGELSDESTMSPRALFTAITRQGVLFVWPVRLPPATGRYDSWSQSAMEAANLAKDRWVRVQSNMHLGAYEILEPEGTIPDPEWPEISFGETLRLAFKDRIIDSVDHSVLRELRGA